jgi:hypothetical protein
MFCYAGQAKEGNNNNGSDEQTLQYPRENLCRNKVWSCIVTDLFFFCEELMSHTS